MDSITQVYIYNKYLPASFNWAITGASKWSKAQTEIYTDLKTT